MSNQTFYFKDFTMVPGRDIKTLRVSPLSELFTTEKDLKKRKKTYNKIIKILMEEIV